MNNHHASCVAIGSAGILIRGASGAGKSTLVLQLIDTQGYWLGSKPLRGRLVSDDQTILIAQMEKLIASPPLALAGVLEVRGIGLINLPYRKSAAVKLIVDLVPTLAVPRLPETSDLQVEIEGIVLPKIAITIGNAAAPAIVRAALQHLR